MTSSAHVLVAGGSGFVGRAVVEALLQRGSRVTVGSRDPEEAALPAGATAARYEEVPADIEVVVNLAGAHLAGRRWTAAYKRELVASRIDFTGRLVEQLRARGARPAVWLNASAVGVYGDRGSTVLDEASPLGTGFLADLCRGWEEAANGAADLGARVAVLRLGVVLARGGGMLGKMEPQFRWFLGGPLGNGQQYMSWIHRDDLVRLLLWVIDRPAAGGTYNATAPEPCTNRELSRALGRELRRPCLLPVPRPLLRLAAGEVARHLVESQRAVPARARAAGFQFLHRRCSEALAALYG